MSTPLKIVTAELNRSTPDNRIFDMTGRCAFVICTEGDFEIRILNETYRVRDYCLFACMPFVNIEIASIEKESKLILGYIKLEDVPKMINRWVNTSNLSDIQNHPLVKISETQFRRLMASIYDYSIEIEECRNGIYDNICNQIQNDILDYQTRLIIALVLKVYLSNVPMHVKGHTPMDIVFQNFMFDIYANYREHRNVRYYAMRSGLSLKYFSTVVRKISGTCPSDWIEMIVVGEAKSMLNDPNRSIKDIAATLNFPDAPTFTKYFLRITGITPRDYRHSLK